MKPTYTITRVHAAVSVNYTKDVNDMTPEELHAFLMLQLAKPGCDRVEFYGRPERFKVRLMGQLK